MLRLFHSEDFMINLPPGHRFPIQKYELVRQQLEHEGSIRKGQAEAPVFVSDEEVCLAHDPVYWQRVKRQELTEKEIRRIGFPRSEMLMLRCLSSASGTVRAAEAALDSGCGMNLAGGTHHAFVDKGEGFCVLNDIAIAARVMLSRSKIQKALVVDLDVHQGNGTAEIFRNDDRVFTFSLHCRDNYPNRKEKSDLDIELPAGTGDVTYLALLNQVLPELIEAQNPDLIFYQAGVDVLQGDRLGKLSLSLSGCLQRDKGVISLCRERRIPLVVVMGGGYHSSLADLVTAHANTYKTAIDLYDDKKFYIQG